jgi:hypothetical protein
MPFRFSFDPPSNPASVDAFIKAYPNLPGYHMWSTWDRFTAVSTYGPPGSEEDDEPDSGWDFSGLDNPSVMRDFMTAYDYCLSDCSDDSHSLGDEDCGPSCECFHVDLEGLDEGNHLGMPEDGNPSRPAPRVDILQELAVVPVPAGGQYTQLEQIRKMQARLDEEAGQLVQLRQNIGQERTGRAPAGEARHLLQDVQHRIADCNTPGVYIPLNNEYGFKHVISVNKTDAKILIIFAYRDFISHLFQVRHQFYLSGLVLNFRDVRNIFVPKIGAFGDYL